MFRTEAARARFLSASRRDECGVLEHVAEERTPSERSLGVGARL